MKMTPQAKHLWETIPPNARIKILNNVWCGQCLGGSSMGMQTAHVKQGDLILRGVCTKCRGPVARLIETSEAAS